MKKYLIIIVISVLPTLCFATAQVGDLLIWNNDTLVMFSNPLDKYCDSCFISRKIIDELYRKDSLLHPDKYSHEYESLESTACWRGYFAEWKLINNKLYLSRIVACNDSDLILEANEIFPQLNNEELFAEWYTGEIILPKGECIEYVHLDYKSIYEKEVVLNFSNGFFVDSVTYKNSIGKKSTFFDNYCSEKSQEFIYGNIQWEKFPDFNGVTITAFVGIQPNENGQIDSINFEYTYALDDKGIISDLENIFIKEAIRIARLIPDWDVVYHRGSIVDRGFSINFNEIMKDKYAR